MPRRPADTDETPPPGTGVRGFVARRARGLLGELFQGFDRLFGSPAPVRAAGPRLLAALVAVWWIQVPIHELLHAAGCVLTGGRVTLLEISPLYGGTVLERIFPFVEAGGDYAGRLSGFTPSSDLGFLATDFAPYLATIFLGVPLLRAGGRRRSPELFAAGAVFFLMPWVSLTGDYYEMASIIVTSVALTVGAPVGRDAVLSIRSDDVFRLGGELALPPDAWQASFLVSLVVVSVFGAILLAAGTCEASRAFGDARDRIGRKRERGGADAAGRPLPDAGGDERPTNRSP